jgi:hypothetical protein
MLSRRLRAGLKALWLFILNALKKAASPFDHNPALLHAYTDESQASA